MIPLSEEQQTLIADGMICTKSISILSDNSLLNSDVNHRIAVQFELNCTGTNQFSSEQTALPTLTSLVSVDLYPNMQTFLNAQSIPAEIHRRSLNADKSITPMYNHSNSISIHDAVLLIGKMSVKHKLSAQACDDLLKLIQCF